MMFQNSQDKAHYGLYASVSQVISGNSEEEMYIHESYYNDSDDFSFVSSFSASLDAGSSSSFLEPQVRVSSPDETGNVSTISY